MNIRTLLYSLILPAAAYFFLPLDAHAGRLPQVPAAVSPAPAIIDPSTGFNGTEMAFGSANAEIHVTGPGGVPLEESVVVTLLRVGGQMYTQGTADAGFVKFERIPYSEFTVQVVAPGYKTASKQFEVNGPGAVSVVLSLQPLEAEEAAASRGFYALPRNVQRDVGKALEALRANKPNNAIKHLQAAQRGAPNSAEIEYLFSLYSTETKDPVQARAYWMKTLEFDPRHLSTLLAVGQDFLRSGKPAEAMPYLKRAVNVDRNSWRAQALLSEACVLQDMNDEARNHALRAIELGHDRASAAELVLVRVMVQKGEVNQAIPKLEAYVKAHPTDKDTANYLERLKHPPAGSAGPASGEMSVVSSADDAFPVPSNWLPPDVDASVPAVEPGVSCNVDDVVSKAGKQLMELAKDVDRFTATETLVHESIDKYGIASAPEKRIFNYVASIQQVQHGFLNVEEYRSTVSGGPAEFPGGVATNGLPALVLIFYPNNADDFTMSCEGLARLSDRLAWQVHFKQKPDKPNVIKRYRIGADGTSYPVALKGRAWISADTYQIVRLETDLVAPMPQIRLKADRAEIEYGPVIFAKSNVSMWLPKSADVYYDWMGRRIHRRHSFSNYLLFAVDDKQKISVPKADDAPSPKS